MDGRRHGDGPSSPQAPDVRGAVPPRVGADQRGQENPGELRAAVGEESLIEEIAKLVRGENLSEDEAASAFEGIMRGDATPVQIARFLVALRMNGATRN